jgi:hypothetical protein
MANTLTSFDPDTYETVVTKDEGNLSLGTDTIEEFLAFTLASGIKSRIRRLVRQIRADAALQRCVDPEMLEEAEVFLAAVV